MALPPEPLADVLAMAEIIIVGEVETVLRTDGDIAIDEPADGVVDSGIEAPAQTVLIHVARVLRGEQEVGSKIIATKPKAGYRLEAGNKGAFLLGGRGRYRDILGRYGPDTYRLVDIEAALT